MVTIPNRQSKLLDIVVILTLIATIVLEITALLEVW